MLRRREMRDAVRVGRKRVTRARRSVRGGALHLVRFGRADGGGGGHLLAAPRATFKTRTPALAQSRNLRPALRLCRNFTIHPIVRAVGLRFRRRRVFVRRCGFVVRVSGRFRRRRVRLVEFGAATVVFVRRRSNGDVRRARVIHTTSRDDSSQHAAPRARRERENQAEDESQSPHKPVQLFAAYIQPSGCRQFNMDTRRRANLQRHYSFRLPLRLTFFFFAPLRENPFSQRRKVKT
jgi:hypothetical protein